MSFVERLAHFAVWAFFLLLPLATIGGTFAGFGVEDPEHPDGVSLRDERAHGNGLFFHTYRRTHTGGGFFGGK